MTLQSDALSEEGLILGRLRAFHAGRVKELSDTWKPNEVEVGLLVLHLVPQESLSGRARFEGTELKKHGARIGPPGQIGESHRGRFNIGGWYTPDGRSNPSAYSQLNRDGRLEGVLSGICHADQQRRFLFDRKCEDAVLGVVGAYLPFSSAIGIKAPIWLLASLVGCEGARLRLNHQFGDLSEYGVEARVATLPEVEIASLDAAPHIILRPWCDALWQSFGIERSGNYKDDGERLA